MHLYLFLVLAATYFVEANYITSLYFNSLKAKQALKNTTCTEESSVVQELGKMNEINLLEI